MSTAQHGAAESEDYGNDMSQERATAAAVRASGLGRRFGAHWALAHVDLAIEPGEVVLLAGPNGSGKTTLLRLIAGLYKPTRGELRVFGLEPQRQRLSCRRLLSLVSHESYLYDRLTAVETLRIWARLLGRDITEEELLELLAEVDLAGRRDLPVGGFSAGMKKRLTLVRSRLERPRMMLLDEPFSALDAAGRKLVESWFERWRSDGVTVVMASHTLVRACRLCDRAVLLERGQIAWTGSGPGLLQRVGESA